MSLLDTGGRARLKGWLMQQSDRPHAWHRKKKVQYMDLLIELELNMGLARGQN